ncbi:hypothetical protein BC830DRAFT_1084043 [Chytriomyces sp. MP71]|nr:hypothetical protein BC830DRAFT_1084043 [Chytriomyces sp. MP71]
MKKPFWLLVVTNFHFLALVSASDLINFGIMAVNRAPACLIDCLLQHHNATGGRKDLTPVSFVELCENSYASGTDITERCLNHCPPERLDDVENHYSTMSYILLQEIQDACDEVLLPGPFGKQLLTEEIKGLPTCVIHCLNGGESEMVSRLTLVGFCKYTLETRSKIHESCASPVDSPLYSCAVGLCNGSDLYEFGKIAFGMPAVPFPLMKEDSKRNKLERGDVIANTSELEGTTQHAVPRP